MIETNISIHLAYYIDLEKILVNMLIDVINHSKSVVELHLSGDREVLTEVKHLPHDRVKKYEHKVSDYINSGSLSKTTRNKIAIALAK